MTGRQAVYDSVTIGWTEGANVLAAIRAKVRSILRLRAYLSDKQEKSVVSLARLMGPPLAKHMGPG